MLENQESWELKDFSEETAGSLTVQDKQGTHEQPSLNKKNTAVDHSGNNTLLRIYKLLNGVIFYKLNYYFLLWIL